VAYFPLSRLTSAAKVERKLKPSLKRRAATDNGDTQALV